MDITIRECRAEDFDAVCRLLQQLWPDRQLEPAALSLVFRNALASEWQLYKAALFQDKIVAFCSLSLMNTLWAAGLLGHIDELVVDEDFRGKSVGRQLLDNMVEEARKKGCRRIELESALHRNKAHKFYLELGYEQAAYSFTKPL